jgi:superfamily II DNA or RNA helicase
MLSEEEISKKLLSFQVAHVYQLMECLRLRNRVIDASDTGTGKTYCAIAVCCLLKLTPFILCPKSVIANWKNVCDEFGIKYLGISNYESLKSGNYYTENYEKVKCPYMDLIPVKYTQKVIQKEAEDEQKIDSQDLKESLKLKKSAEIEKYVEKIKHDYNFYLPSDCIVIFDEAHRCKNWSSQTSNLLIAMNKCDCKIMMLSATLTDKIDCFKPFGIVLNFYKQLDGYKAWIKSKEIINKIKYEGWSEEKKRLHIIHNAIFPQYGSRMKIAELGDLFPSNTISANAYFLDDHLKVEALYKEINAELESLKKLEDKSKALALIIRNRQRIEMLKVTLFMDLVEEASDSGYSVAVFVNYINTLEYLCYHLKVDCIIKGGQGIEERQQMIDDFQSNKKKIIIIMQQAGGVGISLHDIHGGHPRMSIISPSWAGYEMRQTLGRIHRAGSKSPAIQKIVYVAKTYEEQLCNIIKVKLRNIDALNDGELDEHHLEVNEMEEDKNKKEIIPVENNEGQVELKPKKKYKKKDK